MKNFLKQNLKAIGETEEKLKLNMPFTKRSDHNCVTVIHNDFNWDQAGKTTVIKGIVEFCNASWIIFK
ncbi:hypothetical protein KHA80_04475 [Anaerobacillus sp. HL2]|nr:hypothetical protein KHA80_04475 [Anaerobacillus sp. HL2]